MKIRMLVVVALVAGLVPALALAGPRSMHPTLSAKLVGNVEVPKAAASGHGIVNLTLDATKGTVCWTFAGIRGIGAPAAAHIHMAPAGKAGAVVVPFGAAYKAKGCQTATKKLIDGLRRSAVDAHRDRVDVRATALAEREHRLAAAVLVEPWPSAERPRRKPPPTTAPTRPPSLSREPRRVMAAGCRECSLSVSSSGLKMTTCFLSAWVRDQVKRPSV